MSLLQLDEFKTRQRTMWEGGDYSASALDRAALTRASMGSISLPN